MSEQRIEGVKVKVSPHKKWEFDYQPGDVKALYRRGAWHSWQDEINWLQEFGERDNELTPGETVAMTEDLRSLKNLGSPFSENPDQAYQMAHKFRAENNQKFAQEHARAVERARGR